MGETKGGVVWGQVFVYTGLASRLAIGALPCVLSVRLCRYSAKGPPCADMSLRFGRRARTHHVSQHFCFLFMGLPLSAPVHRASARPSSWYLTSLGLASGLGPLFACCGCCGAGPWHHQVQFLLTIAQPTAFTLHAHWSVSVAVILIPKFGPYA